MQRLKKNIEIVVPLKHLSNFWKTLDMPLINCEVFLTLTWSENCVLTDVTTQTAKAAQGDQQDQQYQQYQQYQQDPARSAINAPTNATFQITDKNLHVLTITSSTEIDKKLLEKLRIGFKRTIKWNKFMTEIRLKITT